MTSPEVESLDMRYAEAVRFLYGLERFGILLGLDNIRALLDKIGNPQDRFRAIHVAGSNGKGSTCTFVNSMLMAAGYRTALYTSPHLNDFRERVRLNNRLLPREELVRAVATILPLYDPERTTFFEFTTALAFLCIAEYDPDVAIIETGLGGRLDATNTVKPLVTVITDISREHEDYLGKGLAAVAGEKAGILKPGAPLVTGAGRKEAREVIIRKAAEVAIPVREFGKDYVGKRTGLHTFTYSSANLRLDLTLSMPGSHQVKNAATAVAVVEELIAQGWAIPESAISEGIGKARFPGRFELLRRSPDVIIDGAHTPEGMRLLKSTFRQVYPGIQPLLLLGMLYDKAYEELVKIIAPIASRVICIAPQGDRRLPPETLATVVRSMGIPASTALTIEDGYKKLEAHAGADDVILAAGSLYMIGPVRKACGIGDE